jgi:phosphohistidine phosphatase
MHLIILRHGKAEDHRPEGDFYRELVEKGREQARAAARLLKNAGALPDLVLTSPLLRARQTAEEFCETAAMPGPVIQGWLASGMVAEEAVIQLAAFKDFKNVAIVGHEPDLSNLIESLLGVNYGAVNMKKGAIAAIDWDPASAYGTLLYLVPPKLAGEKGLEE